MAQAAVAQTTGNVQNSQVGRGEQPLGGIHFHLCQIANHGFSGVLAEAADYDRRRISGKLVDIRHTAGDIFRRMEPPQEMFEPFRRAGSYASLGLAEQNYGVDEHFTNHHGGIVLRTPGFPKRVQFPGSAFEPGKLIVIQQKAAVWGLHQPGGRCADGLTQEREFFLRDRQVDVDAPLPGNGCELVAVRRADHMECLLRHNLLPAIDGVVRAAGCDNKKFVVIVIMEGG